MKVEISEFIEEVKEELLSYENMEETAEKWEKEFYHWLKNAKINKKTISEIKGKKYFHIKDESEIFEIADSYRDAVEEKAVKQYWKDF